MQHHPNRIATLGASVSLVASLGAIAQTGVTLAASLENISNCSLVGTDVLITTGQGAEQRRYKYPWDASIDALCNAKGFAIATPPKPSDESARQASPIPAVPAPAVATAAASGFPSDSTPLAGDDIRAALSNKSYTVQLADRNTWKLSYKANGYFFVNTSTGFNGSGTWKIQDDKVCTDGKDMNTSCGVVHRRGDSLFMKRSANGEIIELRPQ